MRRSDNRNLQEFITDTLETGAIASTATTVAASALGAAELGNAFSPLNAVSHILWGDRAAFVDEATAKETITGVALNGAAVTAWAGLYELLAGRRARRSNLGRDDIQQSLLAGAAVAGIAYVTDYYLVPKRFTPGFEKRLSNKSLFGIYATLALSLGLGGLLTRK